MRFRYQIEWALAAASAVALQGCLWTKGPNLRPGVDMEADRRAIDVASSADWQSEHGREQVREALQNASPALRATAARPIMRFAFRLSDPEAVTAVAELGCWSAASVHATPFGSRVPAQVTAFCDGQASTDPVEKRARGALSEVRRGRFDKAEKALRDLVGDLERQGNVSPPDRMPYDPQNRAALVIGVLLQKAGLRELATLGSVTPSLQVELEDAYGLVTRAHEARPVAQLASYTGEGESP